MAREKTLQFLVNFLAKQIGVASWEVQNYAHTRDITRREHVNKMRDLYNLRTFTLREYRELARWLRLLAMKTENMLRQIFLFNAMWRLTVFTWKLYSPVHFLSLERNMDGRFSNLSQKNR